MDWLMKIDPEWVLLLVGGAFAWWKSRKSGQTDQTLTTFLVDSLRQRYNEFFADPGKRIEAQTYFTNLAWKGLESQGFKRSKTKELLVSMVVQKALSELDREIRSREDLKRSMMEMLTSVAKVSFEPQSHPIIPPLAIAIQEACGYTYAGPGSWCKRKVGHDGDHGEGD